MTEKADELKLNIPVNWEHSQEKLMFSPTLNGEPIGDIHAYLRRGIVTHLFINSGYRGRGYGSTLLRELEELAKTVGVSEMKVAVPRGYGSFYIKRGYTITKDCDIDRHNSVAVKKL